MASQTMMFWFLELIWWHFLIGDVNDGNVRFVGTYFETCQTVFWRKYLDVSKRISASITKKNQNIRIFGSKQIIKLIIQLKRINYQILLTFRIFASCQPLLNALTYCFSFSIFWQKHYSRFGQKNKHIKEYVKY